MSEGGGRGMKPTVEEGAVFDEGYIICANCTNVILSIGWEMEADTGHMYSVCVECKRELSISNDDFSRILDHNNAKAMRESEWTAEDLWKHIDGED